MNEYAPYANEYEATEAFEEVLNDSYGSIDVCGIPFDAGRALKILDPIGFEVGRDDWLTSIQEDMTL